MINFAKNRVILFAKVLLTALVLAIPYSINAQTFDEVTANYTVEQWEKVAHYFLESANKGDSDAQDMLGTMYLRGKGVAKNEKRAVYWFQMASDKGLDTAQLHLGLMYANGIGVAVDNQKAYFWFLVASAHGNPEAGNYFNELQHKITPQQRKAIQIAARKWAPK